MYRNSLQILKFLIMKGITVKVSNCRGLPVSPQPKERESALLGIAAGFAHRKEGDVSETGHVSDLRRKVGRHSLCWL